MRTSVSAKIITVKRIRLAVVLVGPEALVPSACSAALRHAEQAFPTLPILLMSPRADQDALAHATFEYEPLLGYIDPDDFAWDTFEFVKNDSPPPF